MKRPFQLVLLLLSCWHCRTPLPETDVAKTRTLKAPAGAPSLVLITLDTTRSDFIGAYGNDFVATPQLDKLAAAGTHYKHAISPAPLTLPAHASILTGLSPLEHGVRQNGSVALQRTVPTLATLLKEQGYLTGAVVGSRVLDRRFGLDNGFDYYSDDMAAENLGEYGYPERDAAAVTEAALAWLGSLAEDQPYFLWVHYYDPHSPYAPPAEYRKGDAEIDQYAGEIEYMDAQIGRLLAGLPGEPGQQVIAVVGDHGESLGEHGERTHGIFLHRASLEVPLIVTGPGVPAGSEHHEAVSIQRLTASLHRLALKTEAPKAMDAPLPDLFEDETEFQVKPIYSEATMPENAYGWQTLRAVTNQQYRLVVAPKPELYDFLNDPEELKNLIGTELDQARQLKHQLNQLDQTGPLYQGMDLAQDPELAAQLRSLGYMGSAPNKNDGIDPKDGIKLLAAFERAKEELESGNYLTAQQTLRALVKQNPSNLPFLNKLATAEVGAGNGEAAVASLRRAIALNPSLDFTHLALARVLGAQGKQEESRQELERVIKLNPRQADAILALAELAHSQGDMDRERVLLEEAKTNGTQSAAIYTRLGQLEMVAGELTRADSYFARATRQKPDLAVAWFLWAHLGEYQGKLRETLDRYQQAAKHDPTNPEIPLRVGNFYMNHGDFKNARGFLQKAARLGEGSAHGIQAAQLLAQMPKR